MNKDLDAEDIEGLAENDEQEEDEEDKEDKEDEEDDSEEEESDESDESLIELDLDGEEARMSIISWALWLFFLKHCIKQYNLVSGFHMVSSMGHVGKLMCNLGSQSLFFAMLRSISSPVKTCRQNWLVSQTCLRNPNYPTCFCQACNANKTWNQNGIKYHICMQKHKFSSRWNVNSYRFHTSCKYVIEPN